MDLFTSASNPSINQLPYDGTVEYYGLVVDQPTANHYFEQLLQTIQWEHDQVRMFGKLIVTKRKVAWYADTDFAYTYSNQTKKALRWTPELLELKKIVEEITGEQYNSCLLNLYASGKESMSWHSDNEKMLKKDGAIASLSFGACRRFSFKHKVTKKIVSLWLEHGSVLLMKDSTQSNWLHQLPPNTKCVTARINLTFRTIIGSL